MAEASFAAPRFRIGRLGRSAVLDVLRRVPDPWTTGTAVLLTLLVSAPLLGRGATLRYDLVAVPDQGVGPDAWGVGDRLPRAVPLDLVTAGYGGLLPWPSWAAVAAVAGLVLAGTGCARLVPASTAARVVACAVAIWNPWVAERLAIGHVPLVLAYGLMPWVLRAAARAAAGRSGWAPVVLWSCGACLTAPGALLAAAAWLAGTAVGLNRRGARTAAAGGVALAVLNAPWVVAGWLHPAGVAGTQAEALAAFSLRPEIGGDLWLTALSLGGLWNAAAVPASRSTVLAPLGLLLVAALVGLGLVAWSRRGWSRRPLLVGVAAVVLALLLAVLPAVPPAQPAVAELLGSVPGGGLLRDSHRWSAVLAVCWATAAGAGAGLLLDRVGPPRLRGLATGAVVAVVGCMVPDLAWGVAGRVSNHRLPSEWHQAATAVRGDGRLISLPWQPFRRYAWAGDAPVLDPAPRILGGDVLVSDVLTVGSVDLPGEGPVARRLGGLLADGRLSRADLADVGARWVLVQRGTPGQVPALPAGEVVVDTPELLLLDIGTPRPRAEGPPGRRAGVLLALGGALLVVLAAAASATSRGARARARAADTSGRGAPGEVTDW